MGCGESNIPSSRLLFDTTQQPVLHHVYNEHAFPTFLSMTQNSACVKRSSACVDIHVWVGLEMTSIIYCVGSQLDSCSIINETIEMLTPGCPLGEVPEFKRYLEESLSAMRDQYKSNSLVNQHIGHLYFRSHWCESIC